VKALIFMLGLVLIGGGYFLGANQQLVVTDLGETQSCGTPFGPTSMEALDHVDTMNRVSQGRDTSFWQLCHSKAQTWQFASYGAMVIGAVFVLGSFFVRSSASRR
jgi:hypothetical protein